mmetsp:Transcript_19605/g.39741  ORF Transcript_19605/g.39741 Transcript_19605/m.39741 type:complete len:253 (-) Transcript_19605:1196-1954(-)
MRIRLGCEFRWRCGTSWLAGYLHYFLIFVSAEISHQPVFRANAIRCVSPCVLRFPGALKSIIHDVCDEDKIDDEENDHNRAEPIRIRNWVGGIEAERDNEIHIHCEYANCGCPPYDLQCQSVGELSHDSWRAREHQHRQQCKRQLHALQDVQPFSQLIAKIRRVGGGQSNSHGRSKRYRSRDHRSQPRGNLYLQKPLHDELPSIRTSHRRCLSRREQPKSPDVFRGVPEELLQGISCGTQANFSADAMSTKA